MISWGRRQGAPYCRCSTTTHNIVFSLPTANIVLAFLAFLLILQHAAGQVLLPLPILDDDQTLLKASDDHHHVDQYHYVDGGVDIINYNVPRLYIVHLLPPPQQQQHGGRMLNMSSAAPEEVEAWYRSFLPTLTLADSGNKPRLVHSYTNAMCGFAAWLTPREVEAMRDMEGFVDAHPDEPLEPATTHTPKFLQLENGTGLWQQTRWGDGRLIGVVDGGIDPDHVSFAGAGMRPSPQWKGTCEFKCTYPTTCSCTNKLLGAATFNTPQDQIRSDAHGTMCASIAAGDFVGDVADATFANYAQGIASGASPKSYLSFYLGNTMSDAVAAIDRAIADGVNVLSISVARTNPVYPNNDLAIATLAAVEHGIFVAMPAGNDGPRPSTMDNDAPWLLTVGASTHDRAAGMKFVVIDNSGREYPFYGVTQSQLGDFDTAMRPHLLLYPGEGGADLNVMTCNNTLGSDNQDVVGATVLCWRHPKVPPFQQAETVRKSGGVFMVLMNDRSTWGDDLSVVPYHDIRTVVVKHSDSNMIVKRYVDSRIMGPVRASFLPSNSRFNTRPCPVVAHFSSRGPNFVTKNTILKPDILGPGVNILGAKAGSKDQFTSDSGTSLATPHLAGVAALLKSRHLGWSPAAIRSAIMTTANITDSDGNLITDHTGGTASFYVVGAGLVNPQGADDPGLVYDITDATDYLRVLCHLFPQAEVNKFARMGRIVDCGALGRLEPEQLNYPSITMTLRRPGNYKVVHRTVTNVGPAMSEYHCAVTSMPITDVRVIVTPCLLAFSRQHEQLSFTVEVELVPGTTLPSGKVIEGYLQWKSARGRHVVRSPLALIVP